MTPPSLKGVLGPDITREHLGGRHLPTRRQGPGWRLHQRDEKLGSPTAPPWSQISFGAEEEKPKPEREKSSEKYFVFSLINQLNHLTLNY